MLSPKSGVSFISLVAATLVIPAFADEPSSALSLEQQFRDPPAEARPRVWWHWMNGNITKDGIAKDLAWMKRVGIGGLQNFDANIATPQIVAKRLPYMSPEWKDAFRFAASEANRLGLELAIASSPGWTESGGPWVSPPDAMKKLVWSETIVKGGRRFTGKLAKPPTLSGPYQTVKGDPLLGLPLGGETPPPPASFYADAVVLAVSATGAEIDVLPQYSDANGNALDGAAATDADYTTSLDVPRPVKGTPVLAMTYAKPKTVRSATLFMPGAGAMHFSGTVAPQLESSEDGKTWRAIAEMPVKLAPTTVAFAAVKARYFRLTFHPPKGPGFNIAPPPPGVDLSAAGDLITNAMAPKPLHVGYFRLSALDRIDQAEVKAGFSLMSDYSGLSAGIPETHGVALPNVIDLTGRMRPDGTLDWQPPKGRWRILRLGYSLVGTVNHPASVEATGLEVDKFDGAAVRRYFEHYLDMYKDAVGPDLIGRHGVQALLTDSIEVGPSNWTPKIIEQFRKLRGYDPMPWLPALTGTIIVSRSESDKFLYDYRRTLSDLMASEHYGTLAKVAHERGLTVYGEALEVDRSSLGDDIAMRTHADIPMSAVWYFTRSMGPAFSAQVDVKGAASVAHIYGKKFVAAESMTSFLAPWAFAPNDLKRVIDYEFLAGVNRPVIHTSVHVPVDDKVPGLALSVHGQNFNRQEAWAELAKPWIDYIARNSLMMQQGRNVADIAYFYGEEAPLTGLFSGKAVPSAPRSVAYDFINADALMEALTNDGSDVTTPGGARYKAIFLGGTSRMMTLPILRKLATLAEGGATIIGQKPLADPSLLGDAAEFSAIVARLWPGGATANVGKGRIIVTTDIEAALGQAGVRSDFFVESGQPGTDIRFAHRQWQDGESYFVSNGKDRPERVEAHFRVTGKVPQLWRAETGTVEAVSYRIENGETIVPLTLQADEAVHVVFAESAKASSAVFDVPHPTAVATIAGPWQVTFQSNRGGPSTTRFDKLTALNENTDPRIKYFSGIATYTSHFTVPREWKAAAPLWLDLGEAKEVAEVTINGQLAGYAWHAPYRIDISRTAKAGDNVLQVRVANLWVNRLIGDQQPGSEKITWTALPTYLRTAPLKRSGLIGPVTVQTAQ